MRKILSITLVLAAMSLLSTSCEKQSVNDNSDGIIHFNVTANGTKGEITTTSGIQTEGNKFLLNAWLEKDGRGTAPGDNDDPQYIKKTEITLSGSSWSGNASWRNLIWINFWAEYPLSATGRGDMTWPATDPKDITDSQEKTPSFTYEMASYAGAGAASNTPDLLVAYARGKWNEDAQTGGEIKLHMEHVLSAIHFKMGEFDSGCILDTIAISGIHHTGTCKLSGYTKDLTDGVSVSWSVADKLTDSLSFKEAPEDITQGSSILGDNYFFLIPQTMQDKATLSAQIWVDGSLTTKQVSLSGYSWKPGYKYEYTLSYFKNKDELEISTTEYTTSDGTWTD